MEYSQWPPSSLERVGPCAVCRSRDRGLVHQDVEDYFGAAGGKWNYSVCVGCDTAILDPRPRADAIGRAYRDYHTHGPTPRRAGLARFRRDVGLRVVARMYGTKPPKTALGSGLAATLASLSPGTRERARKSAGPILPRPSPQNGSRPRLLDVGCGNGWFLENLRDAGWDVHGQEMDPDVVRIARDRGLNITQGPVSQVPGTFDAITALHVVEHVPDPIEFLKESTEKLRPGGFLYLATPNLRGPGHFQFGKYWRGLEAPRHLYIFTPQSLRRTAVAAGLKVERLDAARNTAIWHASLRAASDNSLGAATPREPPEGPGDELILLARKA